MKLTKDFGWYLLDMTVFTAINIVALYLLSLRVGWQADLFALFTPFRLVLFGLGVYRLADVIADEWVMHGIRGLFEDEKEENGRIVRKPADDGFRGLVASLIHCPSCVGVWVAMIFFYVYVFFPTVGTAFMAIMALSAMERFASKLYNLMEARAKH